MLKIFLEFGKLSRSFLISVCPLDEKFPALAIALACIHAQGLLVSRPSEQKNYKNEINYYSAIPRIAFIIK